MLNGKPITEDSVSSLISSENFAKLSESNQKAAIDSVTDNKGKEGGWLGKFFGNKKENAAMHIAFIICVLLTAVGVFCTLTGTDYWNVIIPAITTGMGYIFGKGDK